jgi:two-component system response regulator PilR (NtrC family)
VRELENILERALAFAPDGVIEVADMALRAHKPTAEPAAAPVAPVQANLDPGLAALPSCLPEYLNDIERDIIQRALLQTRFNRTQAAELLGISFRQLRYQMQKLNINEPK